MICSGSCGERCAPQQHPGGRFCAQVVQVGAMTAPPFAFARLAPSSPPTASQLAHGPSSAPLACFMGSEAQVAVQTGCERTPFSRFLLLLHGKTRREVPAHAAAEARRRTARQQRVREASGGGARARAWRGCGGGGEPDRPDAVAPTGCGGAAGGGGERNGSSLRRTRSVSAGMGWDEGGFEGGEGRRRAKLPSRRARGSEGRRARG